MTKKLWISTLVIFSIMFVSSSAISYLLSLDDGAFDGAPYVGFPLPFYVESTTFMSDEKMPASFDSFGLIIDLVIYFVVSFVISYYKFRK